MKSKTILRWSVLAVSVVLAAMGCWFCWNCPMNWLYGEGQHSVFVRQVVWNTMGLVFFAGAPMVRWKWWQKSAPWLLVVWALLAFYAVFFCRSINGSHRWVILGPLHINVRTLFILVSALFAAWLCSKKHVRPWMIIAAVGVCFAYYVIKVVTDGVRLERITSFFDHNKMEHYGAWMHCQLRAAFGAAKWIGNAGYSVRLLPNPLNDGMASASALLLGRWFPMAAFGLLAMLGGLLSAIWLRVKDVSGRMFLLFWSAGMLAPTVYGFFQCVGFVPPTGCSPVLVGYGGTSVAIFWLGLGIVLSLLREEEGVSARKLGVVNVVCWCALFAAFCLGVVVASAEGNRFHEPPPKASDLGEFGTQAKRVCDLYNCSQSAGRSVRGVYGRP